MYLLKQKRNLSAISFGKHSFVKNLDIKKKKKVGKKVKFPNNYSPTKSCHQCSVNQCEYIVKN